MANINDCMDDWETSDLSLPQIVDNKKYNDQKLVEESDHLLTDELFSSTSEIRTDNRAYSPNKNNNNLDFNSSPKKPRVIPPLKLPALDRQKFTASSCKKDDDGLQKYKMKREYEAKRLQEEQRRQNEKKKKEKRMAELFGGEEDDTIVECSQYEDKILGAY
jgi:hypothetical protein